MTEDANEVVACFEAGRVPPEGFHQREHVLVAWRYLRTEPLPAAIDRFRAGLRRFALAQGKPGLYHETLTLAYLLLIHERMARGPEDEAFSAFLARNPDLGVAKPSALEAYYRPETLASDLARRVFLMPDRLAIPSAGRSDRDTSTASLR
jgi:hypothetical protein